MPRHLILFAREPGREARAKGFSRREAEDFFALLAEDWWLAANAVGARLVVASPPEDRLAWQRCLGKHRPYLWLAQRGASFGERLELAGRAAAALAGHSVIVGGDVIPSARDLEDAFAARESGADAVLAPAPDGGVSLLALRADDLDLLRTIEPRRADVFVLLRARLLSRRRRVCLVEEAPDVDGRRDLRAFLSSDFDMGRVRTMARHALSRPDPNVRELALSPLRIADRTPISLRGPPASA